MMTHSSNGAAGAPDYSGNPTYNDYLYRWRKLVCLREVLAAPTQKPADAQAKADMLKDSLSVLYNTDARAVAKAATVAIDGDDEISLTMDAKAVNPLVEAEHPAFTLSGQKLLHFINNRIDNMAFVLTAIGGYNPQDELERRWFAGGGAAEQPPALLTDWTRLMEQGVVSRRFAMERFVGLTETDIARNEELLAEETAAAEEQPGALRWNSERGLWEYRDADGWKQLGAGWSPFSPPQVGPHNTAAADEALRKHMAERRGAGTAGEQPECRYPDGWKPFDRPAETGWHHAVADDPALRKYGADLRRMRAEADALADEPDTVMRGESFNAALAAAVQALPAETDGDLMEAGTARSAPETLDMELAEFVAHHFRSETGAELLSSAASPTDLLRDLAAGGDLTRMTENSIPVMAAYLLWLAFTTPDLRIMAVFADSGQYGFGRMLRGVCVHLQGKPGFPTAAYTDHFSERLDFANGSAIRAVGRRDWRLKDGAPDVLYLADLAHWEQDAAKEFWRAAHVPVTEAGTRVLAISDAAAGKPDTAEAVMELRREMAADSA